jgi:hypothetical protein
MRLLAGVRDFGNLTASCACPLIFLLQLLFLCKWVSVQPMSKSARYTDTSLRTREKHSQPQISEFNG